MAAQLDGKRILILATMVLSNQNSRFRATA